MKKSTRNVILAVIIAVLVAVPLGGLVSVATDNWTNFDPVKVNQDNLFYDKIDDGEIYDNYQIDAVAKDGIITLDGAIAAVDTSALTFSDPIEIVTLTLEPGTYTFSCFDTPSVKSYFAVGEYTIAGVKYSWLADYAKVPAIELGGEFGKLVERTITLEETVEVTFKIMIAEGTELHDVEAKPVIVQGEEEGSFYQKTLLAK